MNARRPRWAFAAAAALLVLFAANMALRIAHVKFGVDVWRFDDVGEFVVVLLCMVFFVAGLLMIQESDGAAIAQPPNDNQGGVR